MHATQKECTLSTTAGKPEVSIIIPFYNLEGTIARCLDSVLAQTYRDYEVVCVDDGSSDATGILLDEYAAAHEQIVVIHKPNGGLSDARNTGVRESSGRYISFIDGDDFVSPVYLESLVSAMDGKENRLVIGKAASVPETAVDAYRFGLSGDDEARPANRHQVSAEILAKQIPTLAQAKLFVRDYYEEHPFPLGVRYEEVRTIGTLVSCADDYRIVDAPIYGYVLREGSIVRAKNASAAQAVEYMDAIQIAVETFRALEPDLVCERAFFRALMYTRVHDFTLRINDVEHARMIEEIAQKAVSDSFRPAMQCGLASVSQKARVALYRANPHVYDQAMSAYNSKVKGFAAE